MTSCASYLSSRLASVMPIAKAPTGAAMTAQDRARSTRSEIRFRLGFSPRRELLTAMRSMPVLEAYTMLFFMFPEDWW